MVTTVFALLPGLTAFAVFAVLKFRKQKTHSTQVMATMFLMGALYFLVHAFYIMPTRNYKIVMIADIASQFITLFNPPTIYIFVRALAGQRSRGWHYFLLYMPGVLWGMSAIMLYSMMGTSAKEFMAEMDLTGGHPVNYTDSIYRTYIYVCRYGSRFIVLAELVLVILYSVRVMLKNNFKPSNIDAFLKTEQSSPVNNCLFLLILLLFLCILNAVLERQFLIANPILSSILSFIITINIAIGAYECSSFGVNELCLVSLESSDKTKAGKEREIIAITSSAGKQIVNVGRRAKIDEDFRRFFILKEAFLDPRITLESISGTLRTNRTYLSAYLNNEYGTTFRNFLNKCRIEYAKDIIRKNPGSSLESVARGSGFLSTSQFNKKFKELEGLTPGVWIKRLI